MYDSQKPYNSRENALLPNGTLEESAAVFDPLDYINEIAKVQEENCRPATKTDQLEKNRKKRDKLDKDKLKSDILRREKQEKDKMESEMGESEIRTKMEKLEVIAEEAAKIRSRFFERSKGFYKKTKNGVSWIKITGSPDRAAIEAGNNAAHRGNVEMVHS